MPASGRLQTDWSDLYQVHRLDETTAIEETLGVLADLVREGKIRAFGCSSFPVEAIVDGYYMAERRGLLRLRSEQPPTPCSLGASNARYSQPASGSGWACSPGALSPGAFLTGTYRKGRPVDLESGRAALRSASFDRVERFIEIAERLGCTLPQHAIAFPIVHPAVTSVILGPRTLDQLVSALGGANVVLDDEMLDAIDAIVPPGTGIYAPDHARTSTAPSNRARGRLSLPKMSFSLVKQRAGTRG
jgi:aryl-alcohol dehydrogenase-like predicted oxidoreductase